MFPASLPNKNVLGALATKDVQTISSRLFVPRRPYQALYGAVAVSGNLG
jgi:hypothetical protein